VCIHIFGYQDRKAEFLAEDCGLAFQLTNIIRDVKEDAGMRRIYVPREDPGTLLALTRNIFRPGAGWPTRRRRRRYVRPWSMKPTAPRKYYESAKWLMELVDEDSRAALWVLVENL